MIVRLALALCLLAPGLVHAQAAQETPQEPEITRREVGDWTVVCTDEGARCLMTQVGKTAQGEDVMGMEVQKLAEPKTAEGRRLIAIGNFIVPLGVLIQEQLALQVDSGETSRAPYSICQQNGCLVQVPLDEALVDAFRRGARARFTFSVPGDGQPQQVAATISLSGFTRAFNSLP